jgi:hypothetical protein
MSSTLRPWDTWDLDRKFLDDITRWTDNHPESRLDRVLDNICTAIDAGKDFIDLIPDSPFPAGTLIRTLGQLIKVSTVRLYIDLRQGHAKLWHHIGHIQG